MNGCTRSKKCTLYKLADDNSHVVLSTSKKDWWRKFYLGHLGLFNHQLIKKWYLPTCIDIKCNNCICWNIDTWFKSSCHIHRKDMSKIINVKKVLACASICPYWIVHCVLRQPCVCTPVVGLHYTPSHVCIIHLNRSQ